MFSKKLGFVLGAVMIFLAAVAFVIGRPAERDKRIYPIVREYSPYTVEKALGGLKIRKKNDPEFKEEPNAINFYGRLQALEQELGVRLFDRTNRRVSLTDAGRLFLDETRRTLAQVDKSVDVVRRAAHGEIGPGAQLPADVD